MSDDKQIDRFSNWLATSRYKQVMRTSAHEDTMMENAWCAALASHPKKDLKWSNFKPDLLIQFIKENSNFDAKLTEEMLNFAINNCGEGSQTKPYQVEVASWMKACFGDVISADTIERNHRFLEEALELVQACECTQSEAHQLVDYVFNRPIGEKTQEVGGVMVTLAALCQAQSIDMQEAGRVELERVWTKVEQIRAKQASKPRYSPLPISQPVQESDYEFEAFGEPHVSIPYIELFNLRAENARLKSESVQVSAEPSNEIIIDCIKDFKYKYDDGVPLLRFQDSPLFAEFCVRIYRMGWGDCNASIKSKPVKVSAEPVGWLSWVGDKNKIHSSASYTDYEPLAYESRVKIYTDAPNTEARMTELEKELAHWKSNHADVVKRLAIATQRLDLPVERILAMREMETLQTKVAELEKENALLKDVEASFAHLSEALQADCAAMKEENKELRALLCIRSASPTHIPYMDDGEMQDNSMLPRIDYKRDSVEAIKRKLTARTVAKLKGGAA
ncbi:hypothetical protein RGU72_04710 [Undibacterium sp. 5I1]|uniref:hypothetical protein n=1 Tax=unclassified Undibacterium TaxID=2630295 RepID=UPI002AB4FC2A|nr:MULTISPECIES: hypothetical protein [unclassified Undibacterium]MDY7537553.1 hypothetical protein [Undibacterium sp. 5I1]MEB0231938.1 hypothetical protein [Undibacterium sp. 10I3]MEB0256289.1 hypothetical protein [Undibacterium sp. 5I1]